MRPKWIQISLAVLLALGLVIRLYEIGSLSNQFHIDRQYYTAQMVRGQYWGASDSVPRWRREIAVLNQPPMLEPPVIQTVALIDYRLTGGENLWIPRSFSAVMWVMGGYFLFLLARKIAREEAALVAAAFYLFIPFGIAASRSFQANPTMIAFCIISWYTIVAYFEQPSLRRLMAAGTAAAVANLVLIYAVFVIFPLVGWLALQKYGLRRALLKRELWLFAFIALLPSGIYYFLGFFVAGFLGSQTGALFNPHLWVTADFWINWIGRVILVIGLVAFILSIQAVVTTRKPLPAAVLRGLWLGFFIYGFIINWPISSHNYYSMQAIPIAALSLASVTDTVLALLKSPRLRRWIPALSLMIVGIIVADGLTRYLPTTVTTPEMIRDVEIAKKIGGLVDHSPDVLYVTGDYGSLLKFYGEIAGASWPNRWDIYAAFVADRPDMSVEARLQSFMSQHRYRYLVVTAFDELKRQPELEHLLEMHYRMLTHTDEYAIYDLSVYSGGG